MTSPQNISRKEFLKRFTAFAGCFAVSASTPFARSIFPGSTGKGKYRFPQGVASGDPTPNSVVLWTRVVEKEQSSKSIDVVLQVSKSKDFKKVVVEKKLTASSESDYTVRVIVDELIPKHTYYYRFIAGDDISEPLGRTFTAPLPDDEDPVNFSMVSCQHRQLGYMTPYKRMVYEDKQKPKDEQIAFILHLGDFIYEEAWYPKELSDDKFMRRTLRDNVQFPDGGNIGSLRYPVTTDDYRFLYKLYLSDPDLQAARARWPFICVWDDHEFSNNSWQSHQQYQGDGKPAQDRKMAANQAWFEFIPALLTGNDGVSGVEQKAHDFEPSDVQNVPIREAGFNEHYESLEPNNVKAIHSLVIYRSLRWGKNFEIILTDNRSYRSPQVPPDEVSEQLPGSDLFSFSSEKLIDILDGGKTYNNGNPPENITIGKLEIPNPNKNKIPGTNLGYEQKQWFKQTLLKSDARWKIWANSHGAIKRRADFQELPQPQRQDWPYEGYGLYGTDDWSGYQAELKEIMDFVKENEINNFVSLAGDRHNFACGYLAYSARLADYNPIGVEFGVSSITTPTSYEAFEYVSAEIRPKYRHLFVHGEGDYDSLKPMLNMLHTMGVKSCLEYMDSQDMKKARELDNRELGRQWEFLDTSSHGYALICLESEKTEVEFVGMKRPLKPVDREEGPEVIYRIQFKVNSWEAGNKPQIIRQEFSGQLPFPYNEFS